MITYVLEIVMFQLAFLLVYDLFLKKETFFQWNRAYLLVTYVFSLVAPWIKIEAFKTTLPTEYAVYPTAFHAWYSPQADIVKEEVRFWASLAWYEWVFGIGIVIASLLFIIKLSKINGLKRRGRKQYYPQFTKVIIAQSELAFSFFRHVFMGDHIPKEKEANILAHELVHIRQYHSVDLLFFELMRIVFWFNPLSYVYQSRMAELHEFIADARVAKQDKKQQYQLLLSEVFQTQNISFVNQFFKKALIKKRIVMLSKSKSKKVFQLKYLLLLPLVLGMLVYTSCEMEVKEKDAEGAIGLRSNVTQNVLPFATVEQVPIFPGCEGAADRRSCFLEHIQGHIRKHFNYPQEAQAQGIQGRVNVLFEINTDGNIVNIVKKGPHGLLEDEVERIINRLPQMQAGSQDGELVRTAFSIPIVFRLESVIEENSESKNGPEVTFMTIDEVPTFPGCENAADKRACFQERIQEHIRKHFNYPLEAQEQGIEGRVSVVFQITKDGSIANIRKRGPHELLENEVERIIKRLPKMEPGRQDGTSVDVPFSIPVNFVLSEGRG
ncbi:hypothetical protein MTsPCn5_16240 [Croceitalea sp. MTPC5]|uniref:M56 family metallopeptidase n=1 Tax=Croceitalea sp. MTPC5 TaxID=3056565 RepID=UPI002B3FF392|nr:hypothetical protein MTsPCn5_16240 [Croceitalea sp. MTPC5]